MDKVIMMTDDQIRAMLSDIVESVDYDIWKGEYNEETAEAEDQVKYNYYVLTLIVKNHLTEKKRKCFYIHDNLRAQGHQYCHNCGKYIRIHEGEKNE